VTSSQGGDLPGIGVELRRNAPSGSDRQRTIKFIHNNLIDQPGKNSSITSFRGFTDKLFENYAKRKRLFWTDIVALLSPGAVLNSNRIAEKPFVLLNVLRAIFDVIRWPVLVDSALRDPLGCACIIGLFLAVTYIKVVVLWLVIERSPVAARVDRPGIFSSVFYPLYHFVWNLLILRPLSVVAAIYWAILDKPDISIAVREDYEQTIPPCLPYPDAPWFSVWIAKEPSSPQVPVTPAGTPRGEASRNTVKT
jgi:hypothetical protein